MHLEDKVADKSKIEWTDATWNPVTGCSKVSPGCAHCYAEALSLRFGWSQAPWTPSNAQRNVLLHHDRLDQPSSWRTPRMVFVNSMSDLFHELVPSAFIAQVFAQMADVEQHRFQILTKRPGRMLSLLTSRTFQSELRQALSERGRRLSAWPLPNVWLGVSIENNRWVSRSDLLRRTPAAIRFVSAEPLLGPLVDLSLDAIDWLIVGGESGIRHRPIAQEWVRDLRDLATTAGTAFFFKQWGGRTPRTGGRMLDGRTWDELPRARAASGDRDPRPKTSAARIPAKSRSQAPPLSA
jgi:protein gp37